MASSGKSALDILLQLKSLIEEKETTIATQSERIKELEKEVVSLQKENSALTEKLNDDGSRYFSLLSFINCV